MLRLSTIPLVATTLLLSSLLGCHKSDPAPDAPPAIEAALKTGSYKLDGQLVNCQADCASAQDYDSNNNPVDKLFVHLNTLDGNGTAVQVATVTFWKPLNTAASNYKLQYVFWRDQSVRPRKQRTYDTDLRFRLTPTPSGYSGNFEAKAGASADFPSSSTMLEGAFNAQF